MTTGTLHHWYGPQMIFCLMGYLPLKVNDVVEVPAIYCMQNIIISFFKNNFSGTSTEENQRKEEEKLSEWIRFLWIR